MTRFYTSFRKKIRFILMGMVVICGMTLISENIHAQQGNGNIPSTGGSTVGNTSGSTGGSGGSVSTGMNNSTTSLYSTVQSPTFQGFQAT
ncbi:MAG: hypothetical protein ACRCUY_06065, partial [Thermoguttaceae bacterium]